MSRHPIARSWKGLVAFLVGAVVIFAVSLWSHSYLLAAGALILTAIGYLIYATGESSDLPGTAGDHNKNVPT
jgi:hypothetical protein